MTALWPASNGGAMTLNPPGKLTVAFNWLRQAHCLRVGEDGLHSADILFIPLYFSSGAN